MKLAASSVSNHPYYMLYVLGLCIGIILQLNCLAFYSRKSEILYKNVNTYNRNVFAKRCKFFCINVIQGSNSGSFISYKLCHNNFAMETWILSRWNGYDDLNSNSKMNNSTYWSCVCYRSSSTRRELPLHCSTLEKSQLYLDKTFQLHLYQIRTYSPFDREAVSEIHFYYNLECVKKSKYKLCSAFACFALLLNN